MRSIRNCNRSKGRLHFERLEARDVPATINGQVFLDYDNSGTFNGPDSGIAGVTITLTGGDLVTPLTRTTDALGTYGFTGLNGGTYTVTETQPINPAIQDGKTLHGTAGGNTLTPNVIAFIGLNPTATSTGNSFTEIPIVGTGGAVYEDTNRNGKKDDGESAVVGVTVTLTGTSASRV